VLARLGRRYSRLPLYWHVLAVNAGVLVAATLLLIFAPVSVSVPIKGREAVVLIGGLLVLVIANGILLRVSVEPLERLVRMMRTIDLIEPRERLPVSGGAEVGTVIQTFNEMLDRLEEERRQSTGRIVSALESERRRLGQELHDEIGQRLTGIMLELTPAVEAAPPELRARLVEAQEAVRTTLGLVGHLAWQLRPGILDDLGLVSALDALAVSAEEQAALRVGRSFPASLPPLAPEVELAVYRVAQESLTNALRHSGATHVELELLADGGAVSLRVTDDGRGFAAAEPDGAGIRGMRERALLIGARLVVSSPPGSGVTIALDVPPARPEA